MWKTVRDFFIFSAEERNGILVLLGILGIIAFWPLLSDRFFSQPDIDFKQFDEALALLKRLDEESSKMQATEVKNFSPKDLEFTKPRVEQKLFPFNPNNLPDSLWEQLGLNARQVRTIHNYQSKGGVFRSKKDVQKLRNIPDTLYQQLKPFIQLPDEWKQKESYANNSTHTYKNQYTMNATFTSPTKKTFTTIELNTTDSTALLELPGIGPWFAHKIIDYRDRLGGFISKEQLLEIRGIDSSVFYRFSKDVVADMFEIKKINVNEAGLDVLIRHPYLGFQHARMLFNYRKQHGIFNSKNEIRDAVLMSENDFRKLEPYLDL